MKKMKKKIMRKEPYEEYLESLSDMELVFIRNRVMWECKKRIKEGNKEMEKGSAEGIV